MRLRFILRMDKRHGETAQVIEFFTPKKYFKKITLHVEHLTVKDKIILCDKYEFATVNMHKRIIAIRLRCE